MINAKGIPNVEVKTLTIEEKLDEILDKLEELALQQEEIAERLINISTPGVDYGIED